jgi:hypothetical protein
VLDLNPQHERAAEAITDLGDISPDTPPDSGGLLRKLFGKRKEGGAS